MLLQFTSCLFLILSVTSQECNTFIDTLIAKRTPPQTQLTQLETAYVTFSGMKGEYDLGERKKCDAAEGTKYLVLRAIKGDLSGAFTQSESGVCLPKYCMKEYDGLENDQVFLQKLATLNSWKTTEELNLYDPDASPSKGPLFYAFALVNVLLVLACCIGTYRARENNNFWKSFDVVETLRSLSQTSKECGQDDKLSTFGFLRFFGAAWVICIHITRIPSRTISPFDIDNSAFVNFINTGALAVGFFFFMGGFLSAYTIIGKISKTGVGIKVYFSHIYHRLIRVYPLTMASLFFYWVGVSSLINGAAMGRYVGQVAKCDDLWWRHMLLIYNFSGVADPTCASHLWYIDVDFQAYFMLVVVIFLYAQGKLKLAYFTTFGLIVQSTILSYLRSRNLWGNPSEWYPSTPCRWNEIFIGVIFAFQYYEFKKLKAKRNFFTFCENIPLLRSALILVGLILIASPVLAGNRDPLIRTPFSLGVAFIFMPLATAATSLVRAFLNLRIFQILGKLSFGVYLFHWPVLMLVVMTADELPEHITLSTVVGRWMKVFVIASIISLVYHVILEKPLINLEAYNSKQRSKRLPLHVSLTTL